MPRTAAQQVCSFGRLVPGANHSAGHTRHRSGSKAGDRYRKLACSHAAIRAVPSYAEIRAFYWATAGRKQIKIARTLVALEPKGCARRECEDSMKFA